MNVFVDTEFSSLGSDPRLISIALVAASGDALYIEFTSGWNDERCSRWVVEHVLPQLGRGEKLDRRESVQRIDGWLSGFASTPILISNSSWDAELIANLFAEGGIEPGRCRMHILQFQTKEQSAAFEALRQRYFMETGLRQHHALNDAQALKHAWDMSQQDCSNDTDHFIADACNEV